MRSQRAGQRPRQSNQTVATRTEFFIGYGTRGLMKLRPGVYCRTGGANFPVVEHLLSAYVR